MIHLQQHETITPVKIVFITSLQITQIEYTIVEGKKCVTKYFEFNGKYVGDTTQYTLTEFLKYELRNKAYIKEFEVKRF